MPATGGVNGRFARKEKIAGFDVNEDVGGDECGEAQLAGQSRFEQKTRTEMERSNLSCCSPGERAWRKGCRAAPILEADSVLGPASPATYVRPEGAGQRADWKYAPERGANTPGSTTFAHSGKATSRRSVSEKYRASIVSSPSARTLPRSTRHSNTVIT